jgi:hypothetical protein
VTLLADRARAEPSARTSPAPWRRRFVVHALALASVLVVVHLLTGPGQLTQADEGAALAQARLLADGEGWAMSHPLPAADPAGTAFPIERSTRLGDSFEYVPYAKHPVYPLLLAGAVRLAGEPGAIALSIAGAILASIGAALLARRMSPELTVPTLWLTGLATPLLFYSDVVIAHTLGAAAVAFAALAFTAGTGQPGPRLLALGTVLLALACFLRSEAVLLGIALATVLAVEAWRRRASYAPAAAAFVASMGVYLVDPWLQSRALGGAGTSPARIVDHTGWFVGRIDAIRGTLLSPADELPRATLLGMFVLLALIAAAWLVHRRAHTAAIVGLLVIGAAAAVARLLSNPTGYVPGLLPAAPVLVAGLLLVASERPSPRMRSDVKVLGAVSALFFIAVTATQYSDGSAGPWGGRYFAVGLPLVSPLAVAGLAGGGALLGRRAARVGAAALVVVTLALAGVGITAAHTSRTLRAGLDDALSTESPELVVSVLPGTGRFQYVHVLDEVWLETTPEALGERGPDLRAAGIDRFVLLTPDPARDTAALAGDYEPAGPPVTIRTTVLGVRSVLVTRVQTFALIGA